MNPDKFIALVANVSECNPAGLSAETPLEELGWDSLALLSLVGEIDSLPGIGISVDRVHEATTIGELLALVSDERG